MKEKIIIFDTTLRDGEQALTVSLNSKQKLQIAFALEKLGVDIMEVGFPISSPGDFESVQTIARQIKNSCICGLARCIKKDIDLAAKALKAAKDFRIHIFVGTSNLHIHSKLKKNFRQIIEMATDSIKYARKYTDNIEFSCEDAGRTQIDNLCRIVEAAIHAGAQTINIPDTVGYTTPFQFKKIINTLYNRVPTIDQAVISVHCHNDLGMAVGNSITAIQAGARQIEGTINGIGERAGNTALEEVIMAIKIHEQELKVYTNIKHHEICRTSQIVSQLCNIPIPANKAIIGSNAFSHSSGIHQDGVLKNRKNYEIIEPKSIGLQEVKLNLTSRSGRAAVKHHMSNMGYQDTDYDMNKLYDVFLKLADKKGQVFDYDLEALAFINNKEEQPEYFHLEHYNIKSELHNTSIALVKLKCGSKTYSKSANGNGPIDAIYEALSNITNLPINLEKYQLTSKGHGRDALGQVDILITYNKRYFHGIGLSTDIIESSAQAMINALNHIWRAQQVKIKRSNINIIQKNTHMEKN